VTSANYGYAVKQFILYGYLPVEHAREGTLLEIEYFGRRYPARVIEEPIYDPEMVRLRS
jgi:glycine cleavage system aminomethyltransferase T